MLALSRAIEDEAAVRAEHPMLLGAFQEVRFWRQTLDLVEMTGSLGVEVRDLPLGMDPLTGLRG
jgi:hypothetical protein